MAAQQRCPRCDQPLPPDAPRGVCPACLLRVGLGSGSEGGPLDAPEVSFGFEPTDVGKVLETLARTVGPVPRVLLPDTAPEDGDATIVLPSSTEMPPPGDRYQLFGEIARGGMGAILKGRDADLGRDLAFKVLLETHRDRPELIRRFVEEAQIGGQLQHPGIVPVYELGTFADRRPYFTMKLVKGRTLAALLAERTTPAADRPRFLAIFEQVAQTVAYAHSRGVIHRDLKPANVMVGSFGEVQVMDWGLAKVLREGGIADEPPARPGPHPVSVIQTVRSGSADDASQAGSVLGTPAYMPPEQASGDVDQVDRRADVFGLGSILCEVLTGAPSYTGRTAWEVLRKAARGDLADALGRLDACGADPELIGLAKACLAPGRDDRPRDASAVADRTTAYLNGVQERLRAAEVARAAEEARAEEALRTAEAEAARAEQARRATEAAEARAAAERRARLLQLGLAAAVLALFAAGGGGASWYAQQRQARTARVDSLLQAAGSALDLAERADGASATANEEEARLAIAQATEISEGGIEVTRASRLNSLRDRSGQAARLRALVAALEIVRGQRAEYADDKRADREYAAAFRAFGLDADAVEPRAFGKALAGRPASVEIAGALDDWTEVRFGLSGGKDDPSWRRLVSAARAADPDPWRNVLRALWGRPIEEARAALAKLTADEDALGRQPAASLSLLGQSLTSAGDQKRCATVLHAAWRRFPGDYWINAYLGDSSWSQAGRGYTRPEEAVRFLTAAVAARPASSTAHGNLGAALGVHGMRDEAIAELREAIRLDPRFAMARSNLGNLLRERGELDEAIAELREAVRLAPEIVEPRVNLGTALKAQGKSVEAIAELREAIRLDPACWLAHSGLGVCLKDQGKFDEAIAAHREAVRLAPANAVARLNFGNALASQGHFDDAVAAYREAIRLDPKLAMAHVSLGTSYHDRGRLVEAVVEFREAIRLDPGIALAHANLGAALSGQGKLEEGIVEFREAIRLDPGLPLAWMNLSRSLRIQGKLDEALAAYRRASEVQPPDSPMAGELIAATRDLERQIALTGRLPGVLAGDDKPGDVTEGLAFAAIAYDKGLYAAAARLFGRALESESKLADDREAQRRYNAACAAALAAAGRGDDDPKPDDATRAKLRDQARLWLIDELKAWKRVAMTVGDPDRPKAAATLTHWKADADLAGVRDPEALAKLPEAERTAWRALWADVDALLMKVGKP